MAKKKHNKTIQLPLSPVKYIRNRCRKLPIGECLINDGWQEMGMANIFITRKHSNDNLTIGMYLVDTYCLGVKDTFYQFNISTIEYRDMIESVSGELTLIPVDYTLAHNIIFGAIEYAEDYDFSPHKDFLKTTQYILEEDNDNVEIIDVEFGFEGKPFLIINDENEPYKNYMRTLDETAGTGNYKFTLPAGKHLESFEDDPGDKDYYGFLEPTWFDDNIEEKVKREIDQINTWTEIDWDDVKNGKREVFRETSIRISETVFFRHFTEEEIDDAYNFGEKLFDVEIDHETLLEEEDRLPNDSDMDSFYRALEILYEGKPKEALRILKSLTSKHPDKPMLLKYMIACLLMNNKNRKADDLIIYSYQRFPENIMIKTQYLWYLVRNSRYDEMGEVFNNKFTLREIFPQKESFTENHVLDFFKVIFAFFLNSNNLLRAKAVLFKLKFYGIDEEEEETLDELMLNAIDVFLINNDVDNIMEDKT